VPGPRPGLGSEIAKSRFLAAATDTGLVHDANEDAFAIIDQPGFRALVACDGMSSSQRAAEAAAAAAEAAARTLAARGPGSVREAVAAAHQAVLRIGFDRAGPKDPPSTTIVVAAVSQGRARVAWVGDTRAYLVAPEGTRALTRDHSWAAEQVAEGVPEDEAMRQPNAHAITRWLGWGDDPESPASAPEPSVAEADAPAGSTLIACTDGLWNYASGPAEIAALAGPPGEPAVAACRRMVHHALARGGRDNVTAAVLRIEA
jgi:serine/threonine protein phosphatase PrpC